MKHLILAVLLLITASSSIRAHEIIPSSISAPDPSKEKGAYITWSSGGDTYRIYDSGNIYTLGAANSSFDFLYKRKKKKTREIFRLAETIDFASVKKEIMLDDNPRPFIELTKDGRSNKAIWENGTPPNGDPKLTELLEMLGALV